MTKWRGINGFLVKSYSKRDAMEQVLILSCVFSLLLVLVRLAVTGKSVFIFLPWNLALAWFPYGLSKWLIRRPGWIENRTKFTLAMLAWIIFIPNAFYILTDLFHLMPRQESSKWFDLTLILSFAWNGLLFGILSVREMEKIVLASFSMRSSLFFLVPVMWLNAFGVYIGRYMRFNSWDVLTNPFRLAGEVLDMLVHPTAYFHAWGMISCFAVFMIIFYVSSRRMARVMD